MTPTTTRLDARAIKVLAHPLRSRLLTALRLDGPATATTLARALDTNTGATSYHLRRLADVGLVVDDPGPGRQRRWRAAHESHSWLPSDVAGDPDSEAANDWLEAAALRFLEERAAAWNAAKQQWPPAWRDAAAAGDYVLDIAPDRLGALLDEVWEVFERYRAEPPRDDARRVFLFVHGYPDPAGGPPS